MKTAKQLVLIAISALAVVGFSSCATCASCCEACAKKMGCEAGCVCEMCQAKKDAS